MMTNTGTLHYRAPESFSGYLYDERVDVWAVGVTAYELFTGRVPFEAEYEKEVIDLICNHEPEIEGLNISNSAKTFLKKLLTKDH